MSGTSKYVAVYGYTGKNWCAHFPDVPGCVVTGDSLEETREGMRVALKLHLEALADEGGPLPAPCHTFAEVIAI